MIEKGGLVVREIDVGRDSINPVPVHAGIVPIRKNHVNARTVPILENYVDARTVPILESHDDTRIVPNLESRVNARIVHDHADMSTEVQIPQRSNDPTMLLWML